MLILPQNLPDNLRAVRERIAGAAAASGRSVDSVTLLAVGKGQDVATLDAAAELGLRHFGENYLQEGLAKQALLRSRPLTWHFIGQVQSNKTRDIAQHFDWVHTIDRAKVAQRLADGRPVWPGLLIGMALHYLVNFPLVMAEVGINHEGDVNKALAAYQLRGIAELQSSGFAFALPAGEGLLTVRLLDIGSGLVAVPTLGDYRLSVVALKRGYRFDVSTERGVLRVSGEGRWEPGQGGSVRLQLHPEAQLDALRPLLSLAGRPGENGDYYLSTSFR